MNYNHKCNRGDCACYKTFPFAIEEFDSITGDCMLENQGKLNYICVCCKTKHTVDFTKVCNRGIMNLFYQKTMSKMMGIKESRLNPVKNSVTFLFFSFLLHFLHFGAYF